MELRDLVDELKQYSEMKKTQKKLPQTKKNQMTNMFGVFAPHISAIYFLHPFRWPTEFIQAKHMA